MDGGQPIRAVSRGCRVQRHTLYTHREIENDIQDYAQLIAKVTSASKPTSDPVRLLYFKEITAISISMRQGLQCPAVRRPDSLQKSSIETYNCGGFTRLTHVVTA